MWVISVSSVLRLLLSNGIIHNDKDLFSFLTILPLFKTETISEVEEDYVKHVLTVLYEKYIKSRPFREFVLNLFNTNHNDKYYDFCKWILDINVLWVIYNIKKEYGKKIDYGFIFNLYLTRVNDDVDIK